MLLYISNSSTSIKIGAALESTLAFLLLCEESVSVVNNKGIDSTLAINKSSLFSLLLPLIVCHYWLKQLGRVFEKVNHLFFFLVLALHVAAQVAYGSGIGLAQIASICATCERIWQSPGNLYYIQVCLAPIEQGAWRPCRWRNMEARRSNKYGVSCSANPPYQLDTSPQLIGNKCADGRGTNPAMICEQIQMWFKNNGALCGQAGRIGKGWSATNLCWNIETLEGHALQWDPHSIETKEARCTITEGGENKIYGGQMRCKLRDIETSAKDRWDQGGTLRGIFCYLKGAKTDWVGDIRYTNVLAIHNPLFIVCLICWSLIWPT